MKALFLTRDLMFQPKVAAAGAAFGWEVIAAGSIAALETKGVAVEDCRLLFLDLGNPKLDIPGTVAEARKRMPQVNIVAFGPHVHVDRLEAAESAGCNAVLTRGRFESSLPHFFQGGTG